MLPLAQAGTQSGGDLSVEAMMYLSLTARNLLDALPVEDYLAVREALRAVTELDNRFASCLFGVIQVLLAIPVPEFMPHDGAARNFAEAVAAADFEDDLDMLLVQFRSWLEGAGLGRNSALLAMTYLDIFYQKDQVSESDREYASSLEAVDEKWMTPIDPSPLVHRAVTDEVLYGASCVKETVKVQGGWLQPPEFGDISTSDVSGRCVGTVDKRRVVVCFDKGDVVLQFKNARNYFLNMAFFLRPAKIVKTEMRESVVDRDKLVGLPAVTVLLRARPNARLARFVVASLTFGVMSLRQRDDCVIAQILGRADGQYDYCGIAGPSILGAFPVFQTLSRKFYLISDGTSFLLTHRKSGWTAELEDSDEAFQHFGSLSTSLPILRRRR